MRRKYDCNNNKGVIPLIILAIIALAFFIVVPAAMGTNKVVPLRYGDGLTKIRRITYVNNASGSYDSISNLIVTVFPYRDSVTLPDTANYYILTAYLWDGETDTIWGEDYLDFRLWSTFDYNTNQVIISETHAKNKEYAGIVADSTATRLDSLEAALADANLRAKIWGTGIEATLKSLVISNSAGDAVQFTATGSNGDGFRLTGHGTGDALVFFAAGSGDAINASGGSLGGGYDFNGDIQGSLSGSAGSVTADVGIDAGSVDDIWNEDTTGHYTSPHMAFAASQTAAGFTLDEIWEYDTTNISGAQAIGTMLKDTSAYQGTGGLDSATVYAAVAELLIDSMPEYAIVLTDSIWKSLLSARDDVAGSFGDSAKSWKGQSGAGGSGLYTYNMVALDTMGSAGDETDDTLVGSVKITVKNTSTGDNWSISTDATGTSIFSIDSMSYYVLASKTGYIFPTITDTITANETDTIVGYNSFVVATPPSDTFLCAVNGYVYDASYNLVKNAKIIFEIDDITDICNDVIIPKDEYTTQTDPTTGYFSKNLLKTDCMEGTKRWKVSVKYTDGNGKLVTSKEHKFEIPSDSTTYRLVF